MGTGRAGSRVVVFVMELSLLEQEVEGVWIIAEVRACYTTFEPYSDT